MNEKTSSPTEFEVSPYQPPATPITESAFSEERDQLAGRWIRLLAYLADVFIFIVPAIALSIITPFFGDSFEQSNDAEIFLAIGIALIVFVIAVFVVNLVLLHKNGQTIGKRLFAIKIVRTDGSRAGLLRIIFLRFLPTSILSSIPFIGYIFALLDPLLIFQKSRRCLHDLIADTIVIEAFSDGKSHRSTAVIIAVSIIPAFVIVGILAAIAIPAYSDYMNKAKVFEASMLFEGAKIEVETYMQDTGQFPSALGESVTISGAYVASIELNSQEYYIQATMREDESTIGGKTIRWTYVAEQDTWICSAGSPNGVDEKYLPRRCRN
jgi:uncharacterized RDD family membrane protein YckC/Tfp pilus assembly major pilin PilA